MAACAPARLAAVAPPKVEAGWADGTVDTPVGRVTRVRTALDLHDRIGTLKARSGWGRMDYRVAPGLYAVGDPTPESPVLVSANYQLSFDHLRSALAGRDAWLLVLDTHGINVWCAAGKGLFGTTEVVGRVLRSGLARVVSHRKLVLPQLSATGVAAHQVRRGCGFTVVYGPVRAADLPAFLDARMKASLEMRRVRFALRDRAVLVGVELTGGARFALPLAAAFLLLGGLGPGGCSLVGDRSVGAVSAAIVMTAFVAADVLGPLLLPWLPGRAVSLKGAVLGIGLAALLLAAWPAGLPGMRLQGVASALMVPAVVSFVVMNFTGSSTFTSLSGVLREMRVAVPVQIVAGSLGVLAWIAGLFVQGGAR